MFATDTAGIHPLGCQWQKRFETDLALPIGHEVVDVPEPFATMEPQVTQHDVPRGSTAAAILSAVDVEAMQMLIPPSPKFSLRIWLVKPTVSAHRNAVTLQTLPFHRESLILLLYSPEGSSSLECP
jgi:hypothetical protein